MKRLNSEQIRTIALVVLIIIEIGLLVWLNSNTDRGIS